MKLSRKKKGSSLVHYAVHKKDRQVWGGQTLCGAKRVTMSFDPEKVKCAKCMRHTNWTPDQVRAQCAKPMFLCGECDAGQLLFTDQTRNDYELSCTNCDHTERRTW